MVAINDWNAALSHVRMVLRHRGCTREDADDLAQEASLKLICYELAHRIDRPDAFLMRTAINLAIDAHRAQRCRGDQLLPDASVPEVLQVEDPAPTAEATVLGKERMARFSEGLVGLNVKTCRIYLDHRMHGMSYQAIARAHGLSVAAVEKRIARATMAVLRWMEGF